MADVRPFVGRHRSGVIFAALCLSSLLMIGFSSSAVVIRPAQAALSIVSLIQTGVTTAARWVVSTVNSIGELRRSREDVAELRSQVSSMERLSRDIVKLTLENEQLRELLEFSSLIPEASVPAAVIARDPGSLFDTVIINRGRSSGVQIDDPVIASADGFQALVGRVVTVGAVTAMVQPVLDTSSFVAARLQRSRHDGLVEGDPVGRRLIMRYVSLRAEEDLEFGELVITSGMGRLYPRGIQLGRVSEVRVNEHQASIDLILQPLVDFSRLEHVVVLSAVGADG